MELSVTLKLSGSPFKKSHGWSATPPADELDPWVPDGSATESTAATDADGQAPQTTRYPIRNQKYDIFWGVFFTHFKSP